MKRLTRSISPILLVGVVGCLTLTACADAPTGPTASQAEELGPAAAPTAPGAASPARRASPAGLADGTAAPEGEVPFEIVAQGDTLVGAKRAEPLTLALRGDAPPRLPPGELPEAAREALREGLTGSDSALYLVIYAGVQPSSGYRVRLDSITARRRGSRRQLLVAYHVEGPGPDQGAAAVRTYPFLVARVQAPGVQPEDVLFHRHISSNLPTNRTVVLIGTGSRIVLQPASV